ncbi:MAG: ATP-binding cassette domain-containing protein [Gammaproteobacteria bacterium]|jgi:phosphonate transport system ATP-binding protein|nr:ATP-binding cassette domain-containing protein [Gammaproteobacteria bacterium]
MSIAFELCNERLGYNGSKVLDGVTLRIREGERVALVGKSGAGKSTLLKRFFEQRRTDSAIIPQELGLVRPLSLFHNVYMGRLNAHAIWYNLANLVRPMPREVAAVQQVASRLGLSEDKLFERVGELSGGQQQRTAVARAIYQEAEILLGDEPVSSVDGRQSRVVLDNINDAYATAVLSMHDVGLAIAYTDRLIGLEGGRIIFDESTAGMDASDLDFLYQSS